MSTGATSFDDIIKAGRERKKNEALAKEIFGRRRGSPLTVGKREHSTGPSLASRVGVQKASQRTPSLRQTLSAPSKPKNSTEKTWGHDLHHVNNPQPLRAGRLRGSPHARVAKGNRLYDSLTTEANLNGQPTLAPSQPAGNSMSIRGLAGPYVVVASNFAQGTSDADIASAVSQYGGEMLSCKIVSTSPILTAEIIFAEKADAEKIVQVFNDQIADGLRLRVYIKGGLRAPTLAAPAGPLAPQASQPDLTAKMDTYETSREQSDRSRSRADPQYQDGTYGFQGPEEQMDADMDLHDQRETRRDDRSDGWRGRDNRFGGGGPRHLYSDDLYSRPRGRGFS